MSTVSPNPLGALRIALLAACLPVTATHAQVTAGTDNDSQWHWDLSLPAWGTSIDGTVSFGGIPEQHVEAPFSDILKNVNLAFIGHVELAWGYSFMPAEASTGIAPDEAFRRALKHILAGEPVGYALRDQQHTRCLHGRAGRAGPQHAPTQQLQVEVRQGCRVAAVQGYPNEAHVAGTYRLDHSQTLATSNLAPVTPAKRIRVGPRTAP